MITISSDMTVMMMMMHRLQGASHLCLKAFSLCHSVTCLESATHAPVPIK